MNIHYRHYTIAMSDVNWNPVVITQPRKRSLHYGSALSHRFKFGKIFGDRQRISKHDGSIPPLKPRQRKPCSLGCFVVTSESNYTPPQPLHHEQGHLIHDSILTPVLENVTADRAKSLLSDIFVIRTTRASDDSKMNGDCFRSMEYKKGMEHGYIDIVMIERHPSDKKNNDIAVDSADLIRRQWFRNDESFKISGLRRCFPGLNQMSTRSVVSSTSSASTVSSTTTVLSVGQELGSQELHRNHETSLKLIFPDLEQDVKNKLANNNNDVSTVKGKEFTSCEIREPTRHLNKTILSSPPLDVDGRVKALHKDLVVNEYRLHESNKTKEFSLETSEYDVPRSSVGCLQAFFDVDQNCSGVASSRWSSIEGKVSSPLNFDDTLQRISREKHLCRDKVNLVPPTRSIDDDVGTKQNLSPMKNRDKCPRIPRRNVDWADSTSDTLQQALQLSGSSDFKHSTFRDKNTSNARNKIKISHPGPSKAKKLRKKKKYRKYSSLLDDMNQVIHGMKLLSENSHHQEVIPSTCRSHRPSKKNSGNVNMSEELMLQKSLDVASICFLPRHLYRIPEEILPQDSNDCTIGVDFCLHACEEVCQESDATGMSIDLFRHRRKSRQRKRQQISYAHSKQVGCRIESSIEEKRLKHSIETAKSFLRVAQKYVEHEQHFDAYVQLIDALQYCVKQGIPKRDLTRTEITLTLTRIKEDVLLFNQTVRDKVLQALERRADLETRYTVTVNQAVITLKLALELRKMILEGILLRSQSSTKGVKQKSITTANLSKQFGPLLQPVEPQYIPETIISTTARLLFMLSRCFILQGKVKCAQRARRDAEALFYTSRVVL